MPGPLTRPFRPPRLRLSRASVCEGGSAHRVLTFVGGERRGSSPSLFLGGGGWGGSGPARPHRMEKRRATPERWISRRAPTTLATATTAFAWVFLIGSGPVGLSYRPW